MPDSIDFKRECVDPGHPRLSVRRQCDLLGREPVELVSALQAGLAGYFAYYNEERFHAALDYRTPPAVYREAA